MDDKPILITFATKTGKHLTGCSCARTVRAKVSGVRWDKTGAYRQVDTVTCRWCGHSRHYVVRPIRLTDAEMREVVAALKAKRAEARRGGVK